MAAPITMEDLVARCQGLTRPGVEQWFRELCNDFGAELSDLCRFRNCSEPDVLQALLSQLGLANAGRNQQYTFPVSTIIAEGLHPVLARKHAGWTFEAIQRELEQASFTNEHAILTADESDLSRIAALFGEQAAYAYDQLFTMHGIMPWTLLDAWPELQGMSNIGDSSSGLSQECALSPRVCFMENFVINPYTILLGPSLFIHRSAIAHDNKPHVPPRCVRRTPYCTLPYLNETELSGAVEALLADVAKVIGPSINIRPDLPTFCLRSNFRVITLEDRVVGAVQVLHGAADLNDPKVLGRMGRLVRIQMAFYGLPHLFGVLTNYNEVRVCFMSADNDDEPLIRKVAVADIPPPHEPHPSDEAWMEDETPAIGRTPISVTGVGSAVRYVERRKRDSLPCTRVYKCPTEHTSVVELLCTALVWMSRTERRAFPLIQPGEFYRVIYANSARANGEAQLPFPYVAWEKSMSLPAIGGPEFPMYVLSPMQSGADGEVFLAADCRGHPAVVKVVHQGLFAARAEANNWARAYQYLRDDENDDCKHPETSLFKIASGVSVAEVQGVNGAVIMPYVATCTTPEIAEKARGAVEEFIDVLARYGVWHTDLHYRHVGLYVNKERLRAVFVDLSRVEFYDEAAHGDRHRWEARAIMDMRHSLSLYQTA